MYASTGRVRYAYFYAVYDVEPARCVCYECFVGIELAKVELMPPCELIESSPRTLKYYKELECPCGKVYWVCIDVQMR